MTFAEALNEEACSCGLEDGSTWFADSNGNEPETVGDYRLVRNNNGVRVEDDKDGWAVQGEHTQTGETAWAVFTDDYTWSDTK